MKDVAVVITSADLEEPTDMDLANAMLGAGGEHGLGLSLADVKSKKPSKTKRDTIKAEVLSSYIPREWQSGDLINGINLTEHPNVAIRDEINRHLAAGGKILLLYEVVNGVEELRYLQYHEPYTSGGPILDIVTTAAKMIKRQGGHRLMERLVKETKKGL